MKRVFCIILVLAVLICVTACNSNDKNNSDILSVSNEDKYKNAISYIEKEKYDKAIEVLNEIQDYDNSKELLGKVHYIYGSQLFNEQKFEEAYSHFSKASGFSDIEERQTMVNYYGGMYFANNGNCVKGLIYLKETKGTEYEQLATEHVIYIQRELIGGGWIKKYTAKNGKQYQIEFLNLSGGEKSSFVVADRSNGYKFEREYDGRLSIGFDESFFIENDGNDSKIRLKIDFNTISSMDLDCGKGHGPNSYLYLNGTYEKTKSWEPKFNVDISYPKMEIPKLFDNITNKLEENFDKNANDTSKPNETASNDTANQANNPNNVQNNNQSKQAKTNNVYNESNKTSSNKTSCENGHQWKTVDTQTIHHDEVGHYQTVTNYGNYVYKYKCCNCGAIFDTQAQCEEHLESQNHWNMSYNGAYKYTSSFKEIYVDDPYTTKEWIVDKKAYDEIITKYKCSVCGEEKKESNK